MKRSLLLFLIGCGGGVTEAPAPPDAPVAVAPTDAEEPEAAPAPEAPAAQVAAPSVEPAEPATADEPAVEAQQTTASGAEPAAPQPASEAQAPAAEATDEGAPDEGAPNSATTDDAAPAEAVADVEVAPDTPEENAATEPEPTRFSYSWTPRRSFLAVLVRNDPNTMMSAMGHDHVIAASTFSGAVTWDTADLSACDVRISFPVSALAVDPNGSRERVGFEGETSDGDKKAITKNFSGKKQLDADNNPDISFRSTRCVAAGDRVQVTGTLTLRGTGTAVTAKMNIRQADASGFRATGRFTAGHSDWGFSPFSAMAGALKNQEQLEFRMDLRASPTP